MPIPRGRKDAGFSILSAIVGLFLVVGAIYGFTQIMANIDFGNMRTKKRASGEMILASVAMDLERLSGEQVEVLCTALGGFQPTPMASHCLSADKASLAASPVVVPGVVSRIGQTMGWDGLPDPKGKFCADLAACRWRAGMHMMELVIQGYWILPTGQRGEAHLTNRQLTLRRSR